MKKLHIILWGQCENYRRDSDNKRSYPKGQLAFSVFVLTHIANVYLYNKNTNTDTQDKMNINTHNYVHIPRASLLQLFHRTIL